MVFQFDKVVERVVNGDVSDFDDENEEDFSHVSSKSENNGD